MTAEVQVVIVWVVVGVCAVLFCWLFFRDG